MRMVHARFRLREREREREREIVDMRVFSFTPLKSSGRGARRALIWERGRESQRVRERYEEKERDRGRKRSDRVGEREGARPKWKGGAEIMRPRTRRARKRNIDKFGK